MNNMRTLLTYKTRECQTPGCDLRNPKLRNIIPRHRCFDFHGEEDRRRFPFDFSWPENASPEVFQRLRDKSVSAPGFLKDLSGQTGTEIRLRCAYSSAFAVSLIDKIGCLTSEEFAYHPSNFKSHDCQAGQTCQNQYCPFLHERNEEIDFSALRKLLLPFEGPLERLARISSDLRETIVLQNERSPALPPPPPPTRSGHSQAPRPSSAQKSVEKNSRGKSASQRQGGSQPPNKTKKVGKFSCRPNVKQSSRFFIDREVGMFENNTTEFKQFSRLDLNTIIEYICAFLNGFGGSIFFGISDDGIVRGMTIPPKELDAFRLNLDVSLRAFWPKVNLDQVQVHVHEVLYDEKHVIDNKVVIEISVACQSHETFFITDKGDMVIKKLGSINKLSMFEIISFVQNRCLTFPTLKTASALPPLVERLSKPETESYLSDIERTIDIVKARLKAMA